MGTVKEKRTLHKLVSTSFVASHYSYNKKNGNNSKHYTFWKQHSKGPTCQVLMKNWIGHAYGSGSQQDVN